jgi:hypothetical protein
VETVIVFRRGRIESVMPAVTLAYGFPPSTRKGASTSCPGLLEDQTILLIRRPQATVKLDSVTKGLSPRRGSIPLNVTVPRLIDQTAVAYKFNASPSPRPLVQQVFMDEDLSCNADGAKLKLPTFQVCEENKMRYGKVPRGRSRDSCGNFGTAASERS